MPVRSLDSSVLRWPEAENVVRALRAWTAQRLAERTDIVRLGYFGSYARGDWGVGSDLDVVIVVEHADEPFERRGAAWDVTELPVPCDLLVYTRQEWDSLAEQGRLADRPWRDTVWIVGPAKWNEEP